VQDADGIDADAAGGELPSLLAAGPQISRFALISKPNTIPARGAPLLTHY
jgi:hypothetical protein